MLRVSRHAQGRRIPRQEGVSEGQVGSGSLRCLRGGDIHGARAALVLARTAYAPGIFVPRSLSEPIESGCDLPK